MQLTPQVIDDYLKSRHGVGLGKYQMHLLQILFLIQVNCGCQRSLSMIIQPYILISQQNLLDYYYLGIAIASIFIGPIADFRGRVPVLRIAIVVQAIMNISQVSILRLGAFALLQMAQGALNAIIAETSFLLYMESVHHKSRDTGIVIIYLAFVIGQLYGVVISAIIQSSTSIFEWWTFMFIFSLAPIVLGFFCSVWFIKESPYYYLHQNGQSTQGEENETHHLIQFEETQCTSTKDHDVWEVITTTKYQGASQILFLMWFIMEFIYRATLIMLPWISGIAQQQQVANNFKFNVMFEISGKVPGFMICLFVVQNYERRFLITGGFLIIAICYLTTNFKNYLMNLQIFVTNNITHFLQPILTLVTMEIFPTPLRATMFGFTQVSRSVGCMLNYITFNVTQNMTTYMPFSLFTVLIISCTVMGLMLKDNTKDLCLDYMSTFKNKDDMESLAQEITVKSNYGQARYIEMKDMNQRPKKKHHKQKKQQQQKIQKYAFAQSVDSSYQEQQSQIQQQLIYTSQEVLQQPTWQEVKQRMEQIKLKHNLVD